MALRIILELNERRQVFSLDELGNTVLEAIRTVVRQEVEQVLPLRTLPQRTKYPEPNRPVALSKAKAAQALGVSVRTIDNCSAQKEIRAMRIGRRAQVPMHSIEAALKHGALETHGDD
jgi:hypothetical protein